MTKEEVLKRIATWVSGNNYEAGYYKLNIEDLAVLLAELAEPEYNQMTEEEWSQAGEEAIKLN